MTDLLIVKSKVRNLIGKHDANMAGDLPEALSKEVVQMIKKGVNRAKENGRKTVRPVDL